MTGSQAIVVPVDLSRSFILDSHLEHHVHEDAVKPNSFSGVSSSARKKDVAGRSRRPDVENGTRSASRRQHPPGILFTKSVKVLSDSACQDVVGHN